jgi:transcription termination/antitermination protein NusG
MYWMQSSFENWEICLLSNNGGALSETGIDRQGANGEMHGQWFAAYTMSRHEKRIAAQCDRIGIEHFLPLYVLHKTWKNRVRVDVQLPLFPNYIFARLLPGTHVELLQVPGVLSMVRNAAGSVPIPAGDMNALRHFVRCKAFLPHAHVHSGDAVRIHRGPLKGLTGVVLRRNNGLRFVVTLNFIGKSVAVDLDATEFETFGPQSLSQAESRSVPA